MPGNLLAIKDKGTGTHVFVPVPLGSYSITCTFTTALYSVLMTNL